jgi:hypothetical protein
MKALVVWLLALNSVAGLAACTRADGASTVQRSATVRVHVGLYGGPERLGGGMVLNNAPEPGAPISVTDMTGHTRTAKTDAAGVATFVVAPGRYIVNTPMCGHGPQPVTARPSRTAYVQVRCDVP